MKAIDKVIGKLGKTGLKIKANSPKILFISGTVCLAGAVVTSFYAGRHIDEALDVNKENIENIKKLKDAETIINEEGEEEEYGKKQYQKDLTKAYAGAAVDVIKTVGPPIALGVASFLCFKGEYVELGERLGAMTVAYEMANKKYEEARKILKEKDYNAYEKIENASVVSIDPETKEVKESEPSTLDVVKDVSLMASQYAVDISLCKGFTSDPNYNVMWLSRVQDMCNAKLNQVGYLWLSDVYEALGCTNYISPEADKASHIVGWMKGVGDGEVKFNMVLVPKRVMKDADDNIHRLQEVGLIDFNVCGTIFDKI